MPGLTFGGGAGRMADERDVAEPGGWRTNGANRPAPRLPSHAMARASSVFVCSDCGTESAKWHGQCPGCGAWNTLTEEARAPAGRGAGAAARGGARTAAAKP